MGWGRGALCVSGGHVVSSFGFGSRQNNYSLMGLKPNIISKHYQSLKRYKILALSKAASTESLAKYLFISLTVRRFLFVQHVQNCWMCISIAMTLFKYVSTQHGCFPPWVCQQSLAKVLFTNLGQHIRQSRWVLGILEDFGLYSNTAPIPKSPGIFFFPSAFPRLA